MGLEVDIKRFERVMAKQDRDPSLWPVVGAGRTFMVDCVACGNRMAPTAMKSHWRRCRGS